MTSADRRWPAWLRWDRQTRWERRLKLQRLISVGRAVLNGQITYYPSFVDAFERRFAAFVGCKYGVSFCNGTSALEGALFALHVQAGDDVLVPAHTFHATITPILNAGARPIFLDIDPATQTLAPDEISRKVTPATKCVIVVHLFGNPAHMRRIVELARRHRLSIIEDCSHAHGASFEGRRVGSFGDLGCFSMQGDKTVAAGEGGVAVTNRHDLVERLSLFGHYGRRFRPAGSIDDDLWETGVGHKRRAHPLGICIAAVDLEHLDRRNAARRDVARGLARVLQRVGGFSRLESYPGAECGGFYPGLAVVLDEIAAKTCSIESIVDRLRQNGIAASGYLYRPYHKMPHMVDPAYRRALLSGCSPAPDRSRVVLPSLPLTDSVQARTFFLPLPEFADKRYYKGVEDALRALTQGSRT